MNKLKPYRKILFYICIIICLYLNSSTMALFIGIILTAFIGIQFESKLKSIITNFLSLSIIGIGAGMNLNEVISTGQKGIFYTVTSIALTFIFGFILAKIFKTNNEIALLSTTGTAICGGSAIAAMSSATNCETENISISMGIIFILNSLALFIFPFIGHLTHLTEPQFGLWAALAIHDTSSVVGAGLSYGPTALKIATTIKLARALWIIPVTIFIGLIYQKINSKNKEGNQKFKFPWFIIGFLIMSALFTFSPQLNFIGHTIEIYSKKLLIIVLFLIGTSLSLEKIKKVGFKTLLSSTILWILISTISLILIKIDILKI